MKFIEFSHPEGGRIVVHVDHITSANYRPGEGAVKTRLGLDLDQRQNEVIIFAVVTSTDLNSLIVASGNYSATDPNPSLVVSSINFQTE